MKRKVLSIFATVALSFSLISASAFAAGSDELQTRAFESGGKTYTAIKGPFLQPPEGAVEPQFTADELDVKKSKLLDERSQISEWFSKNYSEQFGGTYTDEDGNIVVQIKGKETGLEPQVKSLTSFPENIKISYVKYSKKDLYTSKNNLAKVSEALGLEGVGINGRDNKVNVYISPEKFKTDKEKVLQYINEDMVNWKIEDGLKIQDKAYYLYPGEQIERPLGGNQYTVCSLAFNGTKSSSGVGVTAGHCGNGTWYDLSDGTASIGSMSNAHTSGTYDAGSITYVSGVNRSYFLNGSTLTIGIFDYNGSRQEVGDQVRVHAASGNGSSYGPVTILDESFSPPGSGYSDLIVTQLSGAVGGDSGGLVYSNITSGGKNYACIEGVYKGSLENNQGQEVYDIFSKFSNVYDGLGLSGVYVDPNY